MMKEARRWKLGSRFNDKHQPAAFHSFLFSSSLTKPPSPSSVSCMIDQAAIDQALSQIGTDLANSLPGKIRFERLVSAISEVFPADAVALFRLQGGASIPPRHLRHRRHRAGHRRLRPRGRASAPTRARPFTRWTTSTPSSRPACSRAGSSANTRSSSTSQVPSRNSTSGSTTATASTVPSTPASTSRSVSKPVACG